MKVAGEVKTIRKERGKDWRMTALWCLVFLLSATGRATLFYFPELATTVKILVGFGSFVGGVISFINFFRRLKSISNKNWRIKFLRESKKSNLQ